MEGSIIDFSEEVYDLLDKLASSTQYLPEKPAAEKLVAILKEKLHGEPEKLRSLSTAVNQLLLQICSCDGDVITVKQVPQSFLQWVESILEGDDELISEFRSFLREQNPKKSQTVIHQELAAGFMEKLRNYGEPVVSHFAEIMGEYRLERKKNPHELFKKVRVTFYDYPDIEEEFAKFMPGSEYINIARKSREVVQVGRQKRKVRDEEIELERSGGKVRKLEMKRVEVQVEDSREEIKLKRGVGKEKRFVQVQDRRVELDANLLKLKEKLYRSVDSECFNTAKKSRELGAKVLKWNEQLLCFLGKIEQRFSSLRFHDFLVLLSNYPSKTERAEIENRISGILGKHSDLMSEFQMLEKNLGDKTMWWCTPSYRLQVGPKPDRTEVEMEVLNDSWVCAAPVNKEGSSNWGRNRQKEKTFKDEDERYEKDMMIGWIVAAIEFAEQKLVSRPGAPEGVGRFRLKRCIEQLYGDEASHVLSMIKMEPEKTLPVIKKRLEEKLQELSCL